MPKIFKITASKILETKIKRSRFICELRPADSLESAKKIITEIAKSHKTASHNCWAYIVGNKGDTFHSSDNGEPAGTAGKPILNTLKKNKLTNIVCVVTRYFGGVKLGIRGLIDAYSLCTENCTELCEIKEVIKFEKISVHINYAFFEQFKYKIHQIDCSFQKISYGKQIQIELIFPEENSEIIHDFLTTESKKKRLSILSESETL